MLVGYLAHAFASSFETLDRPYHKHFNSSVVTNAQNNKKAIIAIGV